jgi:hypothetical protein
MEIQIFHYAKSSKKILYKKQKSSRCHNSITNLKFQRKPKYYLFKILI